MPEAAHACTQELIHAGVYVVAGGLEDEPASVVGTDGSVADGPYPNANTTRVHRPHPIAADWDRAGMSEERAHLMAMTDSPDANERAIAAERLVAFVDRPDVAMRLLALLLDERDAFIAFKTSGALPDRGDGVALRVYLKGHHLADEQRLQWFRLQSWLSPRQQQLVNTFLTDHDHDVVSAARSLIARIKGNDTRLIATGWRRQADHEYDEWWSAVNAHFTFRGSTAPEDWPAIREPCPSVTLDLAPIFGGSPGQGRTARDADSGPRCAQDRNLRDALTLS